jgi:hypothetical protein
MKMIKKFVNWVGTPWFTALLSGIFLADFLHYLSVALSSKEKYLASVASFSVWNYPPIAVWLLPLFYLFSTVYFYKKSKEGYVELEELRSQFR